ncbi:MAG: hypothetical protein AAB394_00630 [Patescibacteria group bacterium]
MNKDALYGFLMLMTFFFIAPALLVLAGPEYAKLSLAILSGMCIARIIELFTEPTQNQAKKDSCPVTKT